MRFRLACVLVLLAVPALRADDWPQWLGPQRDGVWRETGILEKFPEGGPKVKWRTPIGGGYAGPAVAGGKVFVTDRVVDRSAPKLKNDFDRSAVGGVERVLCLDEKSGEILWTKEYPCTYTISYAAGPRCTPVVEGDRVYTLGAMGDLKCLDISKKGAVVWEKDFQKDFGLKPYIWGWSANPLLDGDRLICMVGGKDSTVVAFDKKTGKVLWQALTAKEPGYCPPVIFTIGGVRQLIIWHPEAVCGLDPETGKLYWSQPFKVNAGMTISTPRLFDGNKLFVTGFYCGPMMLEVSGGSEPKATMLWKGNSESEAATKTDKLHAVMCTPVVKEGHIYGVCSYGQLRCLKTSDGARIWESLEATWPKEAKRRAPLRRWGNAFIIAHEDRYFLFNEAGELIIAKMTPAGYDEIDRAKIIEPTLFTGGRDYVWTHPAFADQCCFARNDKEIVCVSLAKQEPMLDELGSLAADPAALLARLLADLRAGDDHAALFQGLLLEARVRLGLPAVASGKADEIPAAQQAAYEDAIRAAGREVGQRLLGQNRIAEAWTYFRLIGEPGPVATALDQFTPADDDQGQLGEVLQVALGEGVNPQRGFDLVLERHGVCNAITTVSQTLYQPGPARLHAIRRLVRTLNEEVKQRLRADLEQRGTFAENYIDLPALLAKRDDLFVEDNYHVDLSHLSSVVQFALELPTGRETRLTEELCRYGEKLNSRFQPPSDPPFAEGYAGYRRYFEVLNQKNLAENLAYFTAQAEAAKAEAETTGPGEVLVHLFAALDRNEEALAAYREFLGQADPRRLACPSPIDLCKRLGRFEPLAELCRNRDDAVGYAAALLQTKASAASGE